MPALGKGKEGGREKRERGLQNRRGRRKGVTFRCRGVVM
jgi:hypothetical protein